MTTLTIGAIGEAENRIGWWLPSDTKLLNMDYSISLNDLVNQSSDLMLVHSPNFIEPILIALLESLEFVLQLLELLSKLLVVFSQLNVILLIHLALSIELLLHGSEYVSTPSVFVLKASYCVGVHLLSFFQHLVIEF